MEGLMRGDLVTVAVNSDFGKERPALIKQSNSFACLPTVTVLLVKSDIVDVPPFAHHDSSRHYE